MKIASIPVIIQNGGGEKTVGLPKPNISLIWRVRDRANKWHVFHSRQKESYAL
jgi:hypothetical protein